MIFKLLTSALFFFLGVFYLGYMLITSDPCTRIERATKPVYLAGIVVQRVAEPWSSPSTMKWLEQNTFKSQLWSALFIRKFAYYKAEPPIICSWDAYADLVGGVPMTKDGKAPAKSVQKEEVDQQEQKQLPQQTQQLDLPPLPQE